MNNEVGERRALIPRTIFILIFMVFLQGIFGAWYNKALNTRAGWRRLLRLGNRGSP